MSIDLIIVVAYLVLTLWIGVIYAKETKNIEIFATGGRNFSTGALAATITATYVSGSSFVIGITQGYQDGLLIFFALAGQVIAIMLVAYLFVPRMGEFLGDFSVAESMSKLYGKEVSIITAIAGFMLCTGMIAMQIKILATTFAYFSGMHVQLSVIACAFVMIFYSMSGGIRGVIVTDILQFITFMIVVPAIGISMWYEISSNKGSSASAEIYNHAFSFQSVSGTDYLTLFIFSLIPTLSPSSFQRIIISKNLKQASDALGYSSFIYLIYLLVASMIGVMLFVYYPSVEKKEIVSYMIDQFTAPGLKGLTFIAIIAMAMSTADSNLNSFAVMFTHDFCKQLGLTKSQKSEIRLAKIATVGIGIIALVMSLCFDNLIDLLLFTRNFYMPVIFPALSLAIFGFRSSKSCVLAGMFSGFMIVVIWKGFSYFYTMPIDSLIPATITNFIVYMLSHYLLGAKGGWVGPKDTGPLDAVRFERKKNLAILRGNIAGLVEMIIWVPRNSLKIRTQNFMQGLLGILIIATYFATAISNLNIAEEKYYTYIMQFISCAVGAVLMLSSLWSGLISDKHRASITLYSLVYLVASNMILMLANSFSNVSIISFLASTLAVAFFGRTFITFCVILAGTLGGYFAYYIVDNSALNFSADFSFVFVYSTCLVVFMLLSFMHSHQVEIATLTQSETKLRHCNEMLNSQIALREESLKKALNMQNEILRNVNHEIRTPMSVLKSNTDLLAEEWHESSLQKNMSQVVSGIKNSVDRFYIYASNMLDLSEYRSDRMLFDIKSHDFKKLLTEIAQDHENILIDYDSSVPREVEFDELKIRNLFEELIKNAHQHDYGVIQISIKNDENFFFNNKFYEMLKLSVKDHGVGIPEDELESVFEPFKLSSRTKTNAGGRGMGLAIAREIVRGHNGKIWAENNSALDGGEGVSIQISLPVQHPKDEFLGDVVHIDDSSSLAEIDLGNIIMQIKNLEQRFNGRIPKVLMIDDEVSMINAGNMLVKSLGYEFRGIETGAEAVEHILSDEFDDDIVLLDIMLRDTTGLEVMKKTHNKLAAKNVPVVIQSGLSSNDDLVKDAIKLGAKSLINKPYSRNQIRDLLRQFLEN